MGWFDIFAIIFGFALNPGSIMTGGLAVVAGLSFLSAVVSITAGTLRLHARRIRRGRHQWQGRQRVRGGLRGDTYPRTGRPFWTTLIISIRGLSLSAVPGVVNSYTSCAGLLGNVFAPTGGVLIADYLAMKRARIDELAWHLAER